MSSTPIAQRPRPIGTRQSKLLGPNGKPLSYFLYPSPRQNLRSYKPRNWLSADTRSNVTEYDRIELVNYSRQLFAQIDVLNTAVAQKNNWAFGDAWDPHYSGTNAAWGEEATEWLVNQWMPNANVRGPQYSFKRSLLLSGQSWDVDGDDAMVLTETASGFPQLAFYPATKIGNGRDLGGASSASPTSNPTLVSGGEFDGAKIFDGVIYDRNARAIGLRIIGEDGTHTDISAYNADLAYEPVWSDQGRGIPRIAVGLLQWMSLQDIQEFLIRGLKRAASIGLINKTEEGEAAIGNEVIAGEEIPDHGTQTKFGDSSTTAGSDREVAYEEIEGGEMYYLSSTGNESIEALDFKSPHPNVEAFIERITRGSLSSVGWFYELIDFQATGRAPSRLLCDLANQSIWSRQRTGYRRWKRAIGYAIAKGMKSGYLTRNNDGIDPYLWEPGLPKPLQVDAGNDAMADREALKLGIVNKAILAQKSHGLHYRCLDRQRDMELRESIQRAVQLNKDFPQLSFDRALELGEQRSPNPIAAQQDQQSDSEGRAPRAPAKSEFSVNINGEGISANKTLRKTKFVRNELGEITGAETE